MRFESRPSIMHSEHTCFLTCECNDQCHTGWLVGNNKGLVMVSVSLVGNNKWFVIVSVWLVHNNKRFVMVNVSLVGNNKWYVMVNVSLVGNNKWFVMVSISLVGNNKWLDESASHLEDKLLFMFRPNRYLWQLWYLVSKLHISMLFELFGRCEPYGPCEWLVAFKEWKWVFSL